ncbi:1-phosphatidylinositol 4 [Diplonema papillatum]|nr:1-phosphatidylinositol 4 [Diplonema papillatum]|eukprot:gene7219-11113_t
MGACCSGGAKEWNVREVSPRLTGIINQMCSEVGTGDAATRKAALQSKAKTIALAAKYNYEDVAWQTVIDACRSSSVNTQMAAAFADMTVKKMERCETEDPSEIKMVAAWMRADADTSGTVTAKELAVVFKSLNVPSTADRLKSLVAKHDKQGDGLTFAEFRELWKQMDSHPELEALFSKYTANELMLIGDLERFVTIEQREDAAKATEVMAKYGVGDADTGDTGLSKAKFVEWLLSADFNNILNQPRTQNVVHDMTQPLHRYFIASSHNTYLTKHQLHGESSTDMYRDVLLSGCRCVELDCWDGPNGSPVVYHGYTRTTRIRFEDCIKVINEYAFRASVFPVILSLEVHCEPEQQQQMAQIMRDVFHNTLQSAVHTGPYSDADLSPAALKGRILVKGKLGRAPEEEGVEDDDGSGSSVSDEKDAQIVRNRAEAKAGAKHKKPVHPDLAAIVFLTGVKIKDPVEGVNRLPYEIVSMPEGVINDQWESDPETLAELNKRMLTRVYPAGHRISSKNYHPQKAWNMGAQIVALNYQTKESPELRLAVGKFRDNGGSGYLLKPRPLRLVGTAWNDYKGTEPTSKLQVTVVRGWAIPKPGRREKGEVVDPAVHVAFSGVPEDAVTKAQTESVRDNGYNPKWDFTKQFTLRSVDMACMVLQVRDDSGDVLGEAIVPASCIQQGYRTVALWDREMKPTNAGVLLKMTWLEGGPEPLTTAVQLRSAGAPAAGKADDPRRLSKSSAASHGNSRRSPAAGGGHPLLAKQDGALSEKNLLLGEVVKGFWGDQYWVARVVGKEPENHFVVLFEDGSRCTLQGSDIQPLLPPTHPAVPYHYNQEVYAAWGDDGWFPAVVSYINEDTTCAVEWQDGSGWNTVPLEYLRPA